MNQRPPRTRSRTNCARVVMVASALLSLSSIASSETLKEYPELVSFPSGDLTLSGFLYKPEGKGPFPTVLWNHGSEKLPGQRADLAPFYVARGCVFFVPHRHGHGRSPGEYIGDLQAQARKESPNPEAYHLRLLALHELYLKDTLAAIAWLRRRPFVDTNRLAMSGVSYGGIQTLLAAEADAGIKAYIPFAPAAMSWAGVPELHDRLLQAVQRAPSSIFLLQATNDYNLGPSHLLGPAIIRKGKPNSAKIYPAYGTTAMDGHGGFACKGTNVWGADVLNFLEQTLGPLKLPITLNSQNP